MTYLGVDSQDRRARQRRRRARGHRARARAATSSSASSSTRRRTSRATERGSFEKTSSRPGSRSAASSRRRRPAPRSSCAARWITCRSPWCARRPSSATRGPARSIASTGRTSSSCSWSPRRPTSRSRCRGLGTKPLNLVPIDWVARAIGRARARPARSRAHVPPRRSAAASRPASVFELVARAGGRRGPRGSIPANLAKALLRAPGLERIAKSPRAFLETLTTPVTYERAQRRRAARLARRPACPPLESYVEKLVEYVQGARAPAAARPRPSRVEVEDPLV